MKTLKLRMQTLRGLFARIVPVVLVAAIVTAVPFKAALAQVAPSLGTAQSFAVLGGSAVTNTGPTIVAGDLGVSPGTAVTGFPPGTVIAGTIHAADAVAAQAQSDTTAAYNNLASQACDATFGPTDDLGGQTLVAGVYCFTSSAQLTGALTLNAQGDPNAVWVFKTGSTITTASSSTVQIINGGQNCNVFWQIGSSATLGTGSRFIGSILALTSITVTTNVNLSGRTLARNGAVTLDSDTISATACAVPVSSIPPTVGKAFSPATMNAGGVSTLTITLSNSDTTAANLSSSFTDTLPAGVVVSGNASNTCGGTVAATPGGSTITLTGGSIAASSSCTMTVDVTAPGAGSFVNSIAVGALQTNNGGNAAPAVATLTVVTPSGGGTPTLSKAFAPATINAGAKSTLTITASNPNGASATITSLTDSLPSGVTIAGAVTNTCGGTATGVMGGSTVTLTGGAIPANGSCLVAVPVTAPVAGSYFNALPAGALQTGSGNNTAPAIATLTVVPVKVPPTLSKTFNPATINAGSASTLTITLSNSGTTIGTITAPLTDALPAGVTVSGTATTTCGGTISAPNGGSTITLSAGGTIPANGSCTITVLVTATSAGCYTNTLPAGALQTSNGSNTTPASATLTVTPLTATPPQVSKTFNPGAINARSISTLTITLTNPNQKMAKIKSLTDCLPAGVVVSGTASNTCHGTVTTATDGSTITLTGGSIPANGSCLVTVPVTAKAAGDYTNTLPAGALQTSNGSNTTPAVATLKVSAAKTKPPKMSKSFWPSTIKAGSSSTLTITLTNADSWDANLSGPMTDYFPWGTAVAGRGSTTCGGKLTADWGDSKVSLAWGKIPANGSCTITVPVTAKYKGKYTNKLPVETLKSDHGNCNSEAVATLTVK